MPEGFVTFAFANNDKVKQEAKLAHWPYLVVYKPDGTMVPC